MTKFYLWAALAACATAVWANNPTPVTNLTNGGKYYIYDAHGDDGTTDEQEGGNFCRYAFRYDSATVYGTHIKPATALSRPSLLDSRHVWIAVKADNDENDWYFQNQATKRWIIGGSFTKVDTARVVRLVPMDNEPGKFKVNIPYDKEWYWDGMDGNHYQFTHWKATETSVHPYKFFAAATSDDVNFTLASSTSPWTHASTPIRISLKSDPKWDAWLMHGTYESRSVRFTVTYTPDSATNVNGLRTLQTDLHPDTELWAFVGVGHNQVKIYNKAAGMTKALKKGSATEGATLVNEAEATVWDLAPSTSKTDPNRFFCIKPQGENVYANMQWKQPNPTNVPIGLLKTWAAPDNGSTCWVERVGQPVVDYYSREAFDTIRPALRGVVGDFTSEEAANKAAELAQDAQSMAEDLDPDSISAEDLAKLKAFKAEFDNQGRIPFDLTKTYQLYNLQYRGYMTLDASRNLIGNAQSDRKQNAVTFTPAGNGSGKYYMSMQGKYFGGVAASQQVLTSDIPSTVYTMSTRDVPFKFLFKGGSSDKSYLHEDNRHIIVGWDNSTTASFWYLEPAGEVSSIVAPDASEAASPVVYDLQGRRVASPASGLYIINRRKVIF